MNTRLHSMVQVVRDRIRYRMEGIRFFMVTFCLPMLRRSARTWIFLLMVVTRQEMKNIMTRFPTPAED